MESFVPLVVMMLNSINDIDRNTRAFFEGVFNSV
jgi:hypothetical protein